ncbi:MAG: hypothetical protein RR214_06850, partial [Synergistaceae bacterium]
MAADLKDISIWQEVEHDSSLSENIQRKSLTFTQDVWRRFKQNKTAMVSLVAIILITAATLGLPLVWPYTYSDQNLAYSNVPFRMNLYETKNASTFYVTNDYNILLVTKDGVLGDAAESTLNDTINRRKLFDVGGTEVEINYNDYFQAKRKFNSIKRQAARGEDVDLAAEESAVENMQRYTVTADGKELTST